MKKPLIIAFTLSVLLSVSSFAQVSQYKIQSLFVYNFTKHIKWSSAGSNFTIGILGKSSIADELMISMKGKQVDGKNVEIKVISSLSEAAGCQLLYVPASKSKDLASVIASVENKEVLVVTENDMLDKGAGISFLTVDDKLKFKINQEVLAKGGLQVSGSLLSLAAR